MGLGLTCCVLVFAASALPAQEKPESDPRRGPAEIHDEHLLAQPRLTLTATSPDTLGRGRWSLGVSFLWSNSFSWAQDRPGESPVDRRFLIDGEARTMGLSYVRGLSDRLDLSFRVPLSWRGGGVLDGLIDSWHRVFQLPDGDRPRFRRNAFRVEGVARSGQTFSWSGNTGFGLGDVEIGARFRLRAEGRDGWSLALAPRLSLPTGTGPFDGNGLTFGLQGLAAKRLGRPFDLTLGAGATAGDAENVRGIGYVRYRGEAFVALEWRPSRRWSLVGDSGVATRLIDNIDSYPALHWIANLYALLDLSRRTRLELGFSENIMSQRSTPDFALHLGLKLWR